MPHSSNRSITIRWSHFHTLPQLVVICSELRKDKVGIPACLGCSRFRKMMRLLTIMHYNSSTGEDSQEVYKRWVLIPSANRWIPYQLTPSQQCPLTYLDRT